MFTDQFLESFKNFSDEISKQQFFLVDQVFTDEIYQKLKLRFDEKKHLFKEATIGKGSHKSLSRKIRGDQISWLQSYDENDFEAFFSLLNQIQKKSRRELYLPLKRFEAHLSFYQKGTHYLRHKDRHQNSPSRLLSLVFYLNDWRKEDAGELILYTDESKQVIDPKGNRLVVFKSELEHEVVTAHKMRKSFTAWFRDDID